MTRIPSRSWLHGLHGAGLTMPRYSSVFMAASHEGTPGPGPLPERIPPGFMVKTPWLSARSIDPGSIHNHVPRGWLERVIREVYHRLLMEGAPIVRVSLKRHRMCAGHLDGEGVPDPAGYAHCMTMGKNRASGSASAEENAVPAECHRKVWAGGGRER